jgi:hypothetical protein
MSKHIHIYDMLIYKHVKEIMNDTLKPVQKRQLLFIGGSLAACFVIGYVFGYFVGIILNMAIFVAILFYIRKKQSRALKSLGFSDEKAGGAGFSWFNNDSVKVRYICLGCGAEIDGIANCSKCGSRMKKPIF